MSGHLDDTIKLLLKFQKTKTIHSFISGNCLILVRVTLANLGSEAETYSRWDADHQQGDYLL